jgi:hypothetical protein
MMSFSLEFTYAFSLASQIINDLFPVYLVPFGISLGLMILGVLAWAMRKVNISGKF